MGTVFRKMVTRRLPNGTELIERRRKPTAAERAGNPDLREVVETIARWRDKRGKLRTEGVTTGKDGSPRLLVESGTYFAKYRDGEGIVRIVPTGARTETGARTILADLEKRAERVRTKITTADEDAMIDHLDEAIAGHFRDYLTTLQLEGTSDVHRTNVQRCLERVAKDVGFAALAGLKADRLERWLASQVGTKPGVGMSPRTRNVYRATWVAFGNWCVLHGRLAVNPFLKVARADENADTRRRRRAMTEDELRRLLFVARWRPLAEYGRQSVPVAPSETEGKRKRSNWSYATLSYETIEAAVGHAKERLANNPAFIAELERRGRERALIYKTLVLTGLRKGELASLTVGQIQLDAAPPYVVLNAADEKNRQGSTLPLRADLAADLRAWLAESDRTLQEAPRNSPTVRIGPGFTQPGKRATTQARRPHEPPCGDGTAAPQSEPLFRVPSGLVRILDRDLQAAGIAKRDDRGRTLDVHALRHSFGTLLSKGGVAPRTAQAVMRHSSVDLTMNVYTDPRLLDLHAAVDALPLLTIDGEMGNYEAATGTVGPHLTATVAPTVAPTGGNGSRFETIPGKMPENRLDNQESAILVASRLTAKQNKPLSWADNGWQEERVKGLEPSTSSLGS